MASFLTNIASPVPKAKSIRPVRRSRFFFRMVEDEVAELKAQMAPKKVEPVNKVIVTHANAAKASLPPQLAANINRIREFIVNDLSVLTLALEPAADQAREVLKQAFDTDISPEPFYRLQNMAQQAILIRLAIFLEDYLQLPAGTANDLLPKPVVRTHPQQQLPPQAPAEESASAGTFRALRRTLQQLVDQQGQSNEKLPIGPTFG